MRKNVLSMSIAAMIGGLGLAGGASAAVFSDSAQSGAAVATATTATQIVVDNTGIGHILVVPYYNVQNGNVTSFNLVNTDATNGKLVKVRIRGASNSDDLLDFQVFLSPSDVWSASIAANKTTGIAELTTNDNSCTLPAGIKGTTVPFGTGRLSSSLTGDTLASETREGYIEILNTANIPEAPLAGQGVGAAANNVTKNPLFVAVKHVAGTAPCTAAPLNATLVDPLLSTSATVANAAGPLAANEKAASTMGLNAPTGGLFANSIIVNVPNTTTFPSEAIALRAVVQATGLNATGNLIHFPQVNAAVTTTVIGTAAGFGAKVDAATADPLLKTLANGVKQVLGAAVQNPATLPALAANMLDLPDLSTPYTVIATPANDAAASLLAISQAAHITKSLSATAVLNEILGNTGISAKTDWVFSMPTRRYSVAQNYAWVSTAASGGSDGRLFTNFASLPLVGDVGAFPFFAPSNTTVSGIQICVKGITSTSFDQSETGVVVSTAASFSPPGASAPGVIWCGETNVLSFNAGTSTTASVLGAKVARQNINTTTGLDGWVSLSTAFAGSLVNGAGGVAPVYANDVFPAAAIAPTGLPVVGSAYMQAANAAATAGTSGTYGVRFLHRFTR